MDYQLHELSTLYPGMTGEEYEALRLDIRKNGLMNPVVLWRENEAQDWAIIDGRHRALACDDLGIEPKYEYVNGTVDPVQYVISANSTRRHLSQSQLGMVAAKLRERKLASATGANKHIHKKELENISEAVGVSTRTAERAVAVMDRSKDLASAVESGVVTVRDADAVLNVDDEVLNTALENVRSSEGNGVNTLRREVNNVMRERRKVEIAENPPELPAGLYSTVVIDPPWPVVKIARDVRPNQTGFDYPTMKVEDIERLNIQERLQNDAFVFLWTTQRFLPASIAMMQRWDLSYRFTMVWHKPGGFQVVGGPQFNAEFVVVGALGSPQFLDTKAFPVAFNAPRGKHSEKPDEFYDLLKRVAPGPRLDMFARKERNGFDVWGEEVDN